MFNSEFKEGLIVKVNCLHCQFAQSPSIAKKSCLLEDHKERILKTGPSFDSRKGMFWIDEKSCLISQSIKLGLSDITNEEIAKLFEGTEVRIKKTIMGAWAKDFLGRFEGWNGAQKPIFRLRICGLTGVPDVVNSKGEFAQIREV